MDPPDLRLAGKSSDRNQPHQNQRHHTMDPAATSAIPASDSTTAAARISPAGYFRWVICALLLFGTTKNYMDRGVLVC
jgi:hypothetical protein